MRGWLVVALAVVLSGPMQLAGQSPGPAAAGKQTIPRASDGHPDLDPRRDAARQVAHEHGWPIARRDAFGEFDTFGVLEAIREKTREHELQRLRWLTRHSKTERLIHPSVHVRQLGLDAVDRCGFGHRSRQLKGLRHSHV